MSRLFRLVVVALIAAAAVMLAAWLLRRPLSEAVAARLLTARGVPARYRVTALSPHIMTLADVALGPAGAPDFQAQRVDVHFGWSPFQPRIDRVVLTRPTLRAVLGPSGLSFGSLDRLLPAPGAPATPLPDIDLRLTDARMTLATRGGAIAVKGSGAGRLRGGFAGHFGVDSMRMAGGGCAGRLAGLTLDVTTRRDVVRVVADGTAAGVACGARAASPGIAWHAAATLPPTLDRYAIRLTATSERLRVEGFAFAGVNLVAQGSAATLAGPITGAATAAVRGVAGRSIRAARVTATGRYRIAPADGDAGLTAVFRVGQASGVLPLAPLRAVAAKGAATLAGPLAAVLAARLAAAARDFDAKGRIVLTRQRGIATGVLDRVTVTTATGARLVQTGRITLADGGVDVDGGFVLGGGGMPAVTAGGAGRWRRGAATGNGALAGARWAVPGASIEASRFVLEATPAGLDVAGRIRISGGLGAGITVADLRVPIDARLDGGGSLGIGRQCLPIDWAGATRGDVRVAAGRIIACPVARSMVTLAGGRLTGGASIAAAALRGSIAGAAFAATMTPARFALAGTAERPRVALAPLTLAAQVGARRGRVTIDGNYDFARRRGQGRVGSGELDDPDSPVLIDAAAAAWRLSGPRLDLKDVSARIADRAAPARFEPLRIDGAEAATLGSGVLRARGDVRLAATGARLGRFDGQHDFRSGNGSVHLETGTLTFGPALQPDEITESLRGIVANVRGPVVGSGDVAWTSVGRSSRGTLRLGALALATEALGPVDGITGTLAFDDLFALTTSPGQTLTVARINPGVPVDDGVVVFQMLGPDAAAIDSIRWPYAGGTLRLAPVAIHAGDLRREFLIVVDGLDAQLFLQRFEIKNLNVTGRFDGRLPLVFADGRGRIVGGRLVARAGGGLVQYVGDLGSAQAGAAARLAFDALRRLRYHDLTLDLDGDLDDELVSQVHFAGNNEAAATLAGGPVPLKVSNLPFRFGVTVRAPFRALLGTAASFSDVRPLLRPAPPPVQPQ